MDKQTTPSQDTNTQASQTAAPAAEPRRDSKILWIILGVLVLILLGLYLANMDSAGTDAENATTTGTTTVEDLNRQGSSDDVASIEADLNATNLDGLDAGAEVVAE